MSTYSTPIPGVAQYGQAALAANTAYQKALARLNQQRGSSLRQYGYQGDIDAETGVVGNVRTDPMNKYGAFQTLNRSQAQRDEQARWSGIERGLGTGGGLAAQQRNNTRYSFGAEDAQLGEGLLSTLGGYQDQQTSAANERNAALYQAELAAAQLAIQNRDFNQADYSGLEYPEYGAYGVLGDYPGSQPRPQPKPKPVAKKPILPKNGLNTKSLKQQQNAYQAAARPKPKKRR